MLASSGFALALVEPEKARSGSADNKKETSEEQTVNSTMQKKKKINANVNTKEKDEEKQDKQAEEAK